MEDGVKEKALYARLRHLHSVGKREIMQGSEQEKNVITTPAMLQDSSSGSCGKGTGVAVTGGRGTSQKAVAHVRVKGSKDQNQ